MASQKNDAGQKSKFGGSPAVAPASNPEPLPYDYTQGVPKGMPGAGGTYKDPVGTPGGRGDGQTPTRKPFGG